MKQLLILVLIIVVLVIILAARGGIGTAPDNDGTATTTENVSALEQGLSSGTTVKNIEDDLTALIIETDLGSLDSDLVDLNKDIELLAR